MKLLSLLPLPFLAAGQTVATVGMGGPNFDRYPGYTGAYNFTGTVKFDVLTGTSYTVTVDLQGGEKNQTQFFHVHSGVSCATAAEVGGHFWAPFNSTDPWNVPSLTSDVNGVIQGSFDIDFGYSHDIFIGHAMVIHQSNNARAACGIIAEAAFNAIPQYETAVLGVYPNYTGTFVAGGSVNVWDLDSTRQVVNFRLTGLPKNASGGVHIHEGKTCVSSGAHFWTPHSVGDPWLTTTYTSNGAGVADGSFIVASGYLLNDNLFHAVVIHDASNARIACGTLGGKLVGTVRNLDVYPNYGGLLNNVNGTVDIRYEDAKPGVYRFEVALENGQLNALMAFHIHAGVSCATPGSVGGHFWAPFTDIDPWNTPKLPSDANGIVNTRFNLGFGYSHEQFIGHAVVIHDSSNARLACGLIEDAATNALPLYLEAVLTTYPGYKGARENVSGTVQVRDLDAKRQVVNFRLVGLAGNASGGVHIHEGTECNTSGAHYWAPAGSTDPWNNVTNAVYVASASGVAEGSFIIDSGYLLNGNRYHAIVVHDQANNTRIACGLLGGRSACPRTAIEGTFAACKVYHFTGSSQCSATCSTSLQNLITAFKAQNLTLGAASLCLDEVNATTPWINGALSTLKDRLNYAGVPFCNVTNPATSGAGVASSLFAIGVLPFFFF